MRVSKRNFLHRLHRRTTRRVVVAGIALAVCAAMSPNLALASHPEVSLAGSNFEIDTNANLKVDDAAPSLDWMNVTQINKADLAPGSGDDSFGNGTKEDTPVPSVIDGSIPPNKSDLTNFGVYLETTASGARFLNLYWTRVQEPSGTTNMDFEFNQSSTLSGNGVTPVRTAGDLLIQYDLSQGGTNPQLFVSRWVTTGAGSQCQANNATPCWGTRDNLTAAGDATGSINTTAIPNAEDDGLSSTGFSARTFGEAQLDFDALTGGLGACVSFGSAYLKSRSSDSFTAAVKDFIAPATLNINNCGSITIHKVTENGDSSFAYTTTGSGLSAFSLSNGGTKVFNNVLAGNYSVTENLTAAQNTAGWTLKSLTCTATGTGTSATPSSPTVNITMAAGGAVDCIYTNHLKLSPTIATLLSGSGGSGNSQTGFPGDTFHDSATLSGATANAGGTVTYTAYSNNTCTADAQDAGTKTVTNGVVPDSNSLTFNSVGTFYWQAVYSGDANNNGATSTCTDEVVTIGKNSPTITTKLNGDQPSISVVVGSSVYDTATLTGATADAGGTVTYTVYSDNACTQDARDAGTKTVTNGVVPDSNSLAFNDAGTFYWQAVYSGDTKNNGATSVCTAEVLTVTKKHPTGTTAQDLIPNDSFTLSGGFNATGNVTFSLYGPGDATCSGAPAYTQTVSLAANTAATTNTTFHATTEGTWRWVVTYAGDNNNDGVTLACGVERFTINNS